MPQPTGVAHSACGSGTQTRGTERSRLAENRSCPKPSARAQFAAPPRAPAPGIRVPRSRGLRFAIVSSLGTSNGDVRPGDVLDGRYQIGEEIGRGGMGCVFAARDLKLGREVAVKVISGTAPDEHSLTRFLQEWHAAGSISHPNV